MQSPLKMKKIEIKDLGLIKRANFELKKVNIFIGENYKTEILEIIYNLYTLERKYFEFKLKVDSGEIPQEDNDFCKMYREFVNIFQKDMKLSDSGYIKYETDYLTLKVTKDKLEVVKEGIEPPDSYFYNTSPFFSLDRDSLLSKVTLDEWSCLFDIESVTLKMLKGEVTEKTLGHGDSRLIPLISLRDWGYPDDYLRLDQETKEFCRYRKVPENISPVSNGLQYLAPICLVLEHLKDRLVNGIYIDLPEHGLFPRISQLLVRNLVDDFVFRESTAEDKVEGEDYKPSLYLTTNSDLIVNTILEYKKLVGEVGLIPIREIPAEPLSYEIFNASEKSIDEVYNGVDCFYQIDTLEND